MKLLPEYVPPFAPRLKLEGIQDDMMPAARSVESNLDDIYGAAKSLGAAICLFQESQRQSTMLRKNGEHGQTLLLDFQYIAGRDGAMSIRNFRFALSSIRRLVGRIKPWLDKIDTVSLKETEKDFGSFFPFADHMRHAIAHPEIRSNPEKAVLLSAVGAFGIKVSPTATANIGTNIWNDAFTSTYEGAFVHYRLNSETHLKINEFASKTFSAFTTISC